MALLVNQSSLMFSRWLSKSAILSLNPSWRIALAAIVGLEPFSNENVAFFSENASLLARHWPSLNW